MKVDQLFACFFFFLSVCAALMAILFLAIGAVFPCLMELGAAALMVYCAFGLMARAER